MKAERGKVLHSILS